MSQQSRQHKGEMIDEATSKKNTYLNTSISVLKYLSFLLKIYILIS